MFFLKTKRNKNVLLSYQRERKFRDSVITLSKRSGNLIFLSTFNNPYYDYEVVSEPVSNGTYKIKVTSLDAYDNINSGIEGNVTVDFYPLPPINLSISLDGSTVTLTWQHSKDGAPDNYLIYGNGGSGNVIDKSSPLHTISGSLLTYSFAVADGTWRFVVDSLKSGKYSNNLFVVEITVPSSNTKPPSPGPNDQNSKDSITGLQLSRVSVGKVAFSFLWFGGNLASKFRIYYDNATGSIDYETPLCEFNRTTGYLQTYTTPSAVNSEDVSKTYKFVVRSVTADDVEDDNENEYEIIIDGVAPDNPEDLSLDTVF